MSIIPILLLSLISIICPSNPKQLQEGITAEQTIVVTPDLCATKFGNIFEVYATPMMIALVENTAVRLLNEYLEAGKGTVGTEVNIKHLGATPVGMKVTCKIKLTKIDRKRFVFEAEVYDEKELIGKGTHERFMIDNDKFLNKVSEKLNKME